MKKQNAMYGRKIFCPYAFLTVWNGGDVFGDRIA